MHAALITAYQDLPMLMGLVRRLRRLNFAVYVHLDAKVPYPASDVAALRSEVDELLIRHTIFWGSRTHLLALLDLMGLALKNGCIAYVHTLSGQDYPIKSAAEIDARCDGSCHMSIAPLAHTERTVQLRFERRKLLFPFERPGRAFEALDSALFRLQGRLPFKRTRTSQFTDIYKGMVWVSLPRDACEHAVHSRDAKTLLKDLRTSYLPEEFFFQTLLMNSPTFAPRVRNGNLRYTDWTHRHGSRPAFLDDSDYEPITRSPAIFARKLSSAFSLGLVNRLQQAQALA